MPSAATPNPFLADLCALVGADPNTTTDVHGEAYSATEVQVRWTGFTVIPMEAYEALVARHRVIPPPDLADVERMTAQLARDRATSSYWRDRPDDLAAVEAYLGSLRDHLT